jgi:hypothetical protein
MAIQRHTLGDSNAAIYGETANINYFVKTALVADSAGSVVNKQSTVKAFSRRQYPGDSTPINVSSHPREFMVDPGRRNGAATPGKEMVLDDGTERRSFTYTGPWMDVHAWLVGDAKMALKAYSESARYDIAAAGGE